MATPNNPPAATPAAPAPALELSRGKVKKVNSADTIVIWVRGKDGAPADQMIHLANLVAPKPAVYTQDQSQRDEGHAWQSREALRNELVGTDVTCAIEHRSAKAVFAWVYKGNEASGESLNEIAVSRGLASVKDVNKKNEQYEKLKELQETAKSNKVGIWADDKASKVRKIVWSVDDANSFVAANKGKALRAVVEGVHPGGAGVRAFLQLPGDKTFYYVTVMLAGIRGPPDERLKPRAIYFLESGLIHHDVEIILDGAGNNGQLFGRVKHPRYDIVEGLLANGLAQTQDWSLASMEPAQAAKLRQAEQGAKQKRLNIWKDFKEPVKAAPIAGGNFTAKVVEVVSADMLVVKDQNNQSRKIFLASIKAPRKEAGKEPNTGGKPLTMAQRMFLQPLLFQAREFLRTKLIGKSVQVQIDFEQPKSDSFPEKTCCTVTFNGQNVAVQLVEAGLASVVRYRQDNDQRASAYLDLQTAEATAQKNAVGLYAKKEPDSMKVIDLQNDPIKSKQYFSSLQRSNPNSGIVEFVSSGSRVRVYCAKHACVFPFLFNGIQCPRAGRPELNKLPAQAGEPFGDEALAFTRDLCLQHTIEMEIEGQDKNGAMIGMATIDRSKNLSVELVKAGLASVHHYSADKTRYYRELCAAEEAAKAKKLRIWQSYVEPTKDEDSKGAAAVTEEAPEDTKSERKLELKTVVVSEVTSAVSKFYVQYTNDGPKLEELQNKLQKELKNPAIVGGTTFKRNERAAAKFVDGDWYRVRIEKISQGKAELLYLDYGNRGECPVSQLQPLPAGFSTTPEFAHPCYLAFVKMPKDEDELASTRKCFAGDVAGQQLKMNIEYRITGESYVTLHAGDQDIGKGLIADGLAYHDPRRGERYRKICDEYEKAQDEAKRERRNLWEYGDAREDEADTRN